jgi:hypothetical protein
MFIDGSLQETVLLPQSDLALTPQHWGMYTTRKIAMPGAGHLAPHLRRPCGRVSRGRSHSAAWAPAWKGSAWTASASPSAR